MMAALLARSAALLLALALAPLPCAGGTPLPRAVIDKRLRWFAGWPQIASAPTQQFILRDHSDIVDGVYAFGCGSVQPNGTFQAWGSCSTYPTIAGPLAQAAAAGKEVLFGIAGGALPKAAFDRRDEFAQEVLAAVLAVNASGITLDYEGTCDGTSATLAQFAAT